MKGVLEKMAAEAAELKGACGGPITDVLADWLAPQYALAARERLAKAQGAERWEILRAFVQDWAALRRGDHSAARLQLDREELDWQRANNQTRKEQEFREWLQRPDIRKEFFPERRRGLSAETLKEIEEAASLL